MNSFLYSNTQLCIIFNHIAIFAVGGTWWRALLLVHGLCFGPQGEGDVRRRLQPRGPTLVHGICCELEPFYDITLYFAFPLKSNMVYN